MHEDVVLRVFLTEHSDKFQRYLAKLDNNTKYIIRNNKQLNELYDLFLDYIIDSAKILDDIELKNIKKDLD